MALNSPSSKNLEKKTCLALVVCVLYKNAVMQYPPSVNLRMYILLSLLLARRVKLRVGFTINKLLSL